MNALKNLCSDGNLFNSKYELVEAIDKLLLNLARNYSHPHPPYEKWSDDYYTINQIKQAIKGNLDEYLSENIPNANNVFSRLYEEDFMTKQAFTGYLQEMKDKIILEYDWGENVDSTWNLVWSDYNLLDKLKNAFESDLVWNENAFLGNSEGKNAHEMIEGGIDVLVNHWQTFLYTRKPEDYLKLSEMVRLVEGQIKRYQTDADNE